MKTCRLKVNSWRKIYHGGTNQKKVGVAILVSIKADFRANKVVGEKKDYIIINRSILQEDVIISVFAPNKRVSKYVN